MTFGLRCSSPSKIFVHLLSDNDAGCCSTQLIDGDGSFNVTGLEKFMKEVKLGECGLSYAVVSIMGPQSSGMYFFRLSLRTLLTGKKNLFLHTVLLNMIAVLYR